MFSVHINSKILLIHFFPGNVWNTVQCLSRSRDLVLLGPVFSCRRSNVSDSYEVSSPMIQTSFQLHKITTSRKIHIEKMSQADWFVNCSHSDCFHETFMIKPRITVMFTLQFTFRTLSGSLFICRQNSFHTMESEGCTSVLHCFGSNKLYTSEVMCV